MPRIHFIEANETLLMLDATGNGLEYVGESTTFGREYDLDHVLDEPGDSCFRVIRWNVQTLQSEDVSEQVAEAWLNRFREEQENAGFDLEPSDECLFPAYVKRSEVWANVRDNIQPRRQVYNATRPYSTMNHRAQGMQSGVRV